MPSELSTVTGEQSVEALRHELAEAREQQAASAEILRVISSAPTDLKRVCAEIAASAARLCDAYDVAIGEVIGDKLHLVAHYGPIPTTPAVPLIPGALPSRAALDRRTIHVPDLQAETAEYPEGSDRARRLGFRTILAVPLMRAGEAIGAIAIRRAEVRPFTDRQIDLLKTFADQAVIAIENTRLFEAEQTRAKELQDRSAELVQSLEYQTAISEVLGVISKSPNNVRPVFETIITMAERLCGADFGFVYRLEDDGRYHLVAAPRASETYRTYRAARPVVPGDESIMGRTLLERRAIRVSDVKNDPEQTEIEAHRRGNIRSALAAPLISAGKEIGVMGVARSTARPFSQRQVALIETFANQAVIAIENTRLFEEVQTRTRELAKTVDDLEIASQHKSQFVANMSHELRTPLAAILGYAELMQEGFYERLGQKSLDALTRIRSNGKHLLGLINTVLDIAKIESGQFTLNMTEYAIESVVETVRSATESLAQNKKLALKTEVAKSLPIGLGDEQRLTQVLLNLVGNAIKFTDAGEVRVTAKVVNGHFAVSVVDTGPGIPEQEQTRIFDQFHQVDGSLTKAKGGTGLGLAIAREIVEMHGGRIWVESTLGKGSNFQMKLPIRAEIGEVNV